MFKSDVSVPISTETFLKLVDFLRAQGSDHDPIAAIETAVLYWLDNASWKPELLPEVREQTSKRGYHWKSLYLPEGTDIRMRYKGQTFHAKVVGDDVEYSGQKLSPAELANLITNSNRNAWRDLWIRRPGDNQWTLADELRRKLDPGGEE